jgi:hypothetical protein
MQLANQQVAASYREWHDAQAFFGTILDALVSYIGPLERRCTEYHQACISQVDEMHKLATRNITLQQEVENAEGLTEQIDRQVKELNAVSTHLAERNVYLQQDLEKTRRMLRENEVSSCELVGKNLALQQDLCAAQAKIQILERQVPGADPPPADTSKSENKAHELDVVDRKPQSPDATTPELRAQPTAMEGEYDKMVKESKSAPANDFAPTSVAGTQFEGKENCLDNQETDSTILVASARVSPSLGDGGPKADEGKTNAEPGKRRQGRRGRKLKKSSSTNPGIRVVCG